MSIYTEDDEDLDEDYDDEDEESEEDRQRRIDHYNRVMERMRQQRSSQRREQRFQFHPVVEQPYGRHARPDQLAKHARCSICEMAAVAHPHALCELTPQQVAATQAEPDEVRKYHLVRAGETRRRERR